MSGLLKHRSEGELPSYTEWNRVVDVVNMLLQMRVIGGTLRIGSTAMNLEIPPHQPIVHGQLTTNLQAATNSLTGPRTANFRRFVSEAGGVSLADKEDVVTNRSVDLSASAGVYIICFKALREEWSPLWVDCG